MAVPQEVLNWLYRVLSNNGYYSNVNRVYSDVAQTIATYPSLPLRTDVYTFENGASALLLNLRGTLPVSFRGITYRFPISIWIPQSYPQEGPMVYVTPTPDMMIRPGQHVSGEGKVYHPYLSHWAEASERSTLIDFLSITQDIFAKEPPVISKQQSLQSQGPSRLNEPPPPLPPLPPELSGPPPRMQAREENEDNSGPPPPPPPKPYDSRGQQSPLPQRHSSMRDNRLPLPPLPGKQSLYGSPQPSYQGTQPQYSSPLSRDAPRRSVSLNGYHGQPQPQQRPYQQYPPQEMPSPISPASPVNQPPQPTLPPPPQNASYSQQGPPPPPLPGGQPLPTQHYWQSAALQPTQGPPPPQQSPPPKSKPAPAIDLLTSPLDILLPTATTPHTPPPIPPNPEKDALLTAISHSLTKNIQSTMTKNTSALQSLHIQAQAMHTAYASLSAELSALQSLQTLLTSNEHILNNAIRRADTVMVEAKGREPPPVDDVLVAPTRVGNQLYELCAEDMAAGDAIAGLARALDRGRIGVDVWMRATRAAARERFLKKALIKKIAGGLGLSGG
ncbi:MAG: hypothetical protein M1834_002170 [Cirrosporium novae-zelandiae]|nr:MAG: hypothetical protein M1834_002170 [Cirrosporium novae-zelandiae]